MAAPPPGSLLSLNADIRAGTAWQVHPLSLLRRRFRVDRVPASNHDMFKGEVSDRYGNGAQHDEILRRSIRIAVSLQLNDSRNSNMFDYEVEVA